MNEKENAKPCKHLYGYDEGYGEPEDGDYESPGFLLCTGEGADVVFNYCPLCGIKLREEHTT